MNIHSEVRDGLDRDLSPAVRLAASGIELTQAQLEEIADACWRAVSRPE